MRRASAPSGSGSVARALDLLGDAWTLQIVNEALAGARRFEHFTARLGIARNILSARLVCLVEAEIMERVPYQIRPVRHEYLLTGGGTDLFPLVTALRQWGDKWLQEDGPPLVLVHEDCGREAWFVAKCSSCGGELTHRNTSARRSPPTGAAGSAGSAGSEPGDS